MINFKLLVQISMMLVALSLNLSCGLGHSEDHKSSPPPVPTKKTQCEILKKDENPRPVVVYTSRDIERHFQRTIRLSCEGRVISDGLETVQSPWGKLNILPQIKVTQPKNVGSWNITNRQTCNGGGFRLLDNMGTGIRVWLDVARAALTFEVVPGRNIIDYDFSVCDTVDTQSGKCLKYQYEEKGSVVLDVVYRELTLPGTREIKEPCQVNK